AFEEIYDVSILTLLERSEFRFEMIGETPFRRTKELENIAIYLHLRRTFRETADQVGVGRSHPKYRFFARFGDILEFLGLCIHHRNFRFFLGFWRFSAGKQPAAILQGAIGVLQAEFIKPLGSVGFEQGS